MNRCYNVSSTSRPILEQSKSLLPPVHSTLTEIDRNFSDVVDDFNPMMMNFEDIIPVIFDNNRNINKWFKICPISQFEIVTSCLSIR